MDYSKTPGTLKGLLKGILKGILNGIYRDYSKPHKVGNRTKAKECWDSLYITLKD